MEKMQEMPGFPFPAAGALAGQGVRAASLFGQLAVPLPLIEPEPLHAVGSRRRRLWELPHKFHCPVIGSCFTCGELRSLMCKVMHFPGHVTDFVLHTTAVGTCELRSPLAELLQKNLEKRYRLTVRAMSSMRTNAEVRTVWRQACDKGVNIPATLWACWTHPAVDTVLEQEIFADIHMLQHQLGSGARAELTAMQEMREENGSLRRQLDASQALVEELRAAKLLAVQAAAKENSGLRTELTAAESRVNRLARELTRLRDEIPELKERQTLSAQLAEAESRTGVARQRIETLEKELVRLRDFARYAEKTIETLSREDEILADLPGGNLSGKNILCVGGRSGALSGYREVVEQSGGHFLHHDGGIEESLHRIDNAVAAADIVICQVACISHNAYWRVKEHCKRTGKPCMFVKNAGIASFGRVIEEAGKKDE